jgi:hypothetical protein
VPIAWKEIWEDILEHRFQYTLRTGLPTGEAELLMPLERSGYLEETFITFSFAALRDRAGYARSCRSAGSTLFGALWGRERPFSRPCSSAVTEEAPERRGLRVRGA